MIPSLPTGQSREFRATVHGTVFGERSARVDGIRPREALLLIPDPPMEDEPKVWVHLRSGDPVGYLPPEVNHWLASWMHRGGRATARAFMVRGDDVPSWKRLIVEVRCEEVGK